MELKTIIDKNVLLEKLKGNRIRYVETRKTLIEVYKKKSEEYKKAYEEYDKKLIESNLTETEDKPYPPSIPLDNTEIYDTYVEMVERHCGDTLEIDNESFKRLFMDKWIFINEHIHAMTKLKHGYPTLVSALTEYEG